MDLQSIREEAMDGAHLREVVWLDTTVQLADCMTKSMKPDRLYKAISNNKITIFNKDSKKKYVHPSHGVHTKRREFEVQQETVEAMMSEEEIEEFWNRQYEENAMVCVIGSGI